MNRELGGWALGFCLLIGQFPGKAFASGEALFKALLPRTTEPGAKNRDGQSAADYARSRGHEPVEKLLIKAAN